MSDDTLENLAPEPDALVDDLPEVEAPEVEAVEPAPVEADDEGDDIEISFDGEPVVTAAAAPDNELIRSFRKRQRELAAENARLRAEREAAPVVDTPVDLGPVPTLEDCGYDEDRFAHAVRERAAREAAIERAKADRAEAAAKAAAADAAELAEYAKSRAALGARDYADAEADFVEAVPNAVMQRVVLRAANNPGALIYALGKSPAKLASIAAINDPIKLAAAVAVLEAKMTVAKKASTVQPEKRVSGSAPLTIGNEARYLDKLEAEAAKTGDRTKIYQWKRQQAAREAGKR